MLSLIRTNSSNKDFRELVTLLDTDLRIRDGEEFSFFTQYNKLDNIHYVVVAYMHDQPAGCGAIKEYARDLAEIKRMFVHPAFRKQGIASAVLKELEVWAKDLGFTDCVLETGIKQPEAISLYKKCGYSIIPNYGQYENIASSVCMKKNIQNEHVNSTP